jgi:putative membrane protein
MPNLRRLLHRSQRSDGYLCRMLYVKALHIIFMVAWFAALFYMPRLLIYHVEAQAKNETERNILSAQFKIMQRRLWFAISWPAMILTVILGTWLWFDNFMYFITKPWFVLKLCFVFGLMLYQLQTHVLFQKQQKNIFPWKSFHLRLWNEVATLLLFVIVLLIVPKPDSGWVWGAIILIFFAVALYIATVIYRKNREGKDVEPPADPPVPPPLP